MKHVLRGSGMRTVAKWGQGLGPAAALVLLLVGPGAHAALLARPVVQSEQRSYTALGRVETSDHASLMAPFDGIVSRVVTAPGTTVPAQALLLKLKPLTLLGRVAGARAAAAAARANLSQQRVLAAQKLITQGQLEAAQATLAADLARQQALEAALNLGVVRAPFAGTVRQVVAAGSHVIRGQRLLRIDGSGGLRIEASFPISQTRRLRAGSIATVRADHQRGTATVYAIASAADRYGLVSVYLGLPSGLTLIPGEIVRVRIVLPAAATAWLVPRSTVVLRGRKARVYVDDAGKARPVVVQLRSVGPEGVIVSGALSENSRLVASGVAWLRKGSAVSVAATGIAQ